MKCSRKKILHPFCPKSNNRLLQLFKKKQTCDRSVDNNAVASQLTESETTELRLADKQSHNRQQPGAQVYSPRICKQRKQVDKQYAITMLSYKKWDKHYRLITISCMVPTQKRDYILYINIKTITMQPKWYLQKQIVHYVMIIRFGPVGEITRRKHYYCIQTVAIVPYNVSNTWTKRKQIHCQIKHK